MERKCKYKLKFTLCVLKKSSASFYVWKLFSFFKDLLCKIFFDNPYTSPKGSSWGVTLTEQTQENNYMETDSDLSEETAHIGILTSNAIMVLSII